jgi:hypothetical protein
MIRKKDGKSIALTGASAALDADFDHDLAPRAKIFLLLLLYALSILAKLVFGTADLFGFPPFVGDSLAAFVPECEDHPDSYG